MVRQLLNFILIVFHKLPKVNLRYNTTFSRRRETRSERERRYREEIDNSLDIIVDKRFEEMGDEELEPDSRLDDLKDISDTSHISPPSKSNTGD